MLFFLRPLRNGVVKGDDVFLICLFHFGFGSQWTYVKSSPTAGWCPDMASVNGERIYSHSIFSFILELYFARNASQPPTQAL